MILERYILRNYLGPFLFAISIITFLFIMDFVLRYIDLFLNKGVDFFIVLQAFILSLGHMFALIIPMAVLPATLMCFGNLASENEITAMRANGVSLYRMIRPAAVMGSVLTVLMILYNNYVLPESNHKLLNLLIDINKKKPTVEIKENVFINAFKGYTIYVRHKDDKTGAIRDVQIFRHNEAGKLPTTIVAERGHLQYMERENALRFELENGEIHEMPEGNDPSTYRRTEFKQYAINIEDVDRSLRRTERNYRGDREMSVEQMRDKITRIRADIAGVDTRMAGMASDQASVVFALLDTAVRDSVRADGGSARLPPAAGTQETQARAIRPGDAPNPRGRQGKQRAAITYRALESQKKIKESYFRQIDRYRVEIHKKFSIPFACLIFVLIGSPIALRLGRSGMNTAVALSVLVFMVYYICLIGGEKLADRRIVSPIIAMWVPNAIFGVAAYFLIRRASAEYSVFQWKQLNPLRIFQRAA
ncbi:MAG: LptF/LptG family permease [Candidatus Krumholzibacteriia bacterium]